MSSVIQLDTVAQAHIQEYWEYKNIVGDTDGGKLLSEEEYAQRKVQALEDQKNRVYVTWLNEDGLECRAVGPSSKCFCGHKFRDHDTCNKQKKVACKMSKCACKLFEYIPIRGSQDLKCHCKHSYKTHALKSRKCTRRHPVKGVCDCTGFISSFGCACSQPFSAHYTLFETRTERQRAGKRVDNLAFGTGMNCATMGGITTFSSLLDGVDRVPAVASTPNVSDLQLQFMRPRNKLSENEEMGLYAQKYEHKSSDKPTANDRIEIPSKHGPQNKLKLLKQKQKQTQRKNDQCESKMHEEENIDSGISDISRRIRDIEQALKDSSLSAAKKYALQKNLKMEKSTIIRQQRRQEQEKREFEAGL